MGVVDFETNRLRQQEIEVKALVALAKCDLQTIAFKAIEKLERIAYPEDYTEFEDLQ